MSISLEEHQQMSEEFEFRRPVTGATFESLLRGRVHLPDPPSNHRQHHQAQQEEEEE